jgi:hypothetical protein
MNLETLKSTVEGLNDFNFAPLTAKEAEKLTNVADGNFVKPGFYRVEIGSRGLIEGTEYLGEDVSAVDIPTLEECIALMSEGADEEDKEAAAEYVNEFYMVAEDYERGGVLNFGFTEEEFDYYLEVK